MITTNLRVVDCFACNIARARSNIVSGSGNIKSRVVIIGASPGYNEDKTGKPFVGKSGKLLDKVLYLAGFNRDDLYITNMIKCRPPNNREPSARELINCSSHLIYELNNIKPLIVVLLGRTALQNVLNKDYTMGGSVNKYFVKGGFIFLPMYHPSYILRQESINVNRKYIANFILLADIYKQFVDPLHSKNI